MSAVDIQACVSQIVPCARMCWPDGSAPELPWAVFLADRDETFLADNTRYSEATRWVVELYERYPDEELETRLCTAIQTTFGPYLRSETWVESEGCYQLALYFTERSQ